MSVPTYVQLADVISEAKAGFACGEEDPDGIFQIRMNNLTRQGELDLTRRRRVPAGHRALRANMLQADDVLFNATNSPDLVGKTAVFPGLDEAAAFSNHFLRLRTNRDVLLPRYLAYWLQSQFEASVFRSICKQWVNQATLGRDSLLGLPIPLLQISEQRRIAHVLDEVNALRAKRRKTIAILDDLAQSIFLDMFTDPGEAWSTVTVERVTSSAKGSMRTGPFGSQLLHEEFVDSGVPVLGIDNAVANKFRWQGRRFITDAKYRTLARYTVHPGDVLITIMGTCGRCAVVPDDIPIAINTKHLCCITLDQSKCLPEFLHSYFLIHPDSRQYLDQNVKGAIMSGLNMAIIKELPITLPPIELQKIFSERISVAQAAKAAHFAHLAELDALFASLQHRAFRGELWDTTAA